MIKNILFDLDGTITNSYEGIVNAVKFSLDKINFKYDETKLISFIGPPLKDSYMELGFSETESKARIEDFRDYYFKKGMKEMHLYDGIEDTIKNLHDKGYKIYLATSKVESSAKKILSDNHLLKYFSYVAGATMDQSRVEKEDVIAYLLDKTGIKPEESIMVGDRHHDIEGAKMNNIRAIAAEYGFGNKEEYENSVFVAQKPTDIYDYVINNR
ncbi:MAG: HAD-IA family hydrolase [Finegoldia magna]|uniref:HAD-IA family hydrolase n=1 Tax=Finegoldia sp. TaxID=1981334 RepID=UPI0025EBC143|nr:HAD-IA family hydrolase [uncultured Finegoldia sp.]MDU5978072.1 HAD-IA family hydrolase [Finegoldia magna]